MQVKRTQAHSLRCELEDGLEKWRQQVLEVQENNIRRAEMVAEGTRSLRRQRSREDRRSRERRVMERRRASREREEEELRAKQEVINEKQKRVSGYSLLCFIYLINTRSLVGVIIIRLISPHFSHHFVQVDTILREREESVDRQRRLAAKTARLRRSLR